MAARTPLFLARSSYRSRRLHDAAKLVPIAGVFLLILPLFWSPEGQGGTRTLVGGAYVFLVWAGLILVAALLARPLTRREEGRDRETLSEAGAAAVSKGAGPAAS